ncbi:Apoptosis-inducing factor 3 [Pitangus sulphuratus]|nr:Apoptosis-inducing factor 3 [Pitangus sulphuratus]
MGGCFSKPKPGDCPPTPRPHPTVPVGKGSELLALLVPAWSHPETRSGFAVWLQGFSASFAAVEVKIEVVIPEKERNKEEMSPNGKASPLIYKVNGTARHYHLEEHPIASSPYHNPKDMVEASVCHVKDLENGQMREVDLGCGKALLIKESGEFHAVGHKCPHYGAPLVKGVLSKGRVRCPWHGACFNISTGDIEDFPGLDSLPRFQVKIEKEKVYIRASKQLGTGGLCSKGYGGTGPQVCSGELDKSISFGYQALQTQRRTKMMAKCISLSNYNLSSTNVLIIGAGAAGLVCAETLRQEGFSDRIVMCTMDRHLPYDRPKLSKSMDSQPEQIALRPKEFFCTYDIEVLTEMQVAAVDIKSKIAMFKDGFKMEYNKLLIATGNTPKALSCKGKEMENVFNIRTPEDANRVVKLATSKNVVIVGASFLGVAVAPDGLGLGQEQEVRPGAAGIGSTLGRGSFWQLLTEATPVAPLLPNLATETTTPGLHHDQFLPLIFKIYIEEYLNWFGPLCDQV